MRLDDLRRNVRDETDIPAEVERELEILDAALRGEAVPEGMEGIEALVSDLRAERPEPEPRFEEKLDAWAAAGFPRGKGPRARAAGGGSRKSTGGFFSLFSPDGPRGWAPLAAATAAVVVVGVSLSQIDFGDGGEALTGGPAALEGEASDSADVETGPAAAPSDAGGRRRGCQGQHRAARWYRPTMPAAAQPWKPRAAAASPRTDGSANCSRDAPPAPATTATRRSAASTARRSSRWPRRPRRSPT